MFCTNAVSEGCPKCGPNIKVLWPSYFLINWTILPVLVFFTVNVLIVHIYNVRCHVIVKKSFIVVIKITINMHNRPGTTGRN